MALVVMAGASFNTVSAKDKKDKNKVQNTESSQPVELTTAPDSLSYAAGMAFTMGLNEYLEQQLGVAPNQMENVIRGFNDAIAHENDSAFSAYAAGMQVAEMLKTRMLTGLKKEFDGVEIQNSLVYAGFADALANNHSIYTDSAAQKYFSDARKNHEESKNKVTKEAGETFLAQNKQKPGVITTPSGLQYKVLKEGNGPVPTLTDKVRVVYEGKTLDGNVFDATSKHGKDSDVFGVSGLIKGWTEALIKMPVGSKWELYIPQELAYGERGAGKDIKPYSALVFTLELLGIEPVETKTVAPSKEQPSSAKAAKPQTGAKKTSSVKKKK